MKLVDNSIDALARYFPGPEQTDDSERSDSGHAEDLMPRSELPRTNFAAEEKSDGDLVGTAAVTFKPTIKLFMLHARPDSNDPEHGQLAFVVVADNGPGMTRDELGFRAQCGAEQPELAGGALRYGQSKLYRGTGDPLFGASLSMFGKGLKNVALDNVLHTFHFITRPPLGTFEQFNQDSSAGKLASFLGREHTPSPLRTLLLP